MVKMHKLENGTLCRCVHCAGRRIAFRIVLRARGQQCDRRDFEIMHRLEACRAIEPPAITALGPSTAYVHSLYRMGLTDLASYI